MFSFICDTLILYVNTYIYDMKIEGELFKNRRGNSKEVVRKEIGPEYRQIILYA